MYRRSFHYDSHWIDLIDLDPVGFAQLIVTFLFTGVVTRQLHECEWRVKAVLSRAGEKSSPQSVVVVVKARDRSVFCSISCALAEPVAGLALAERFTERSRNPTDLASDSSRGTT